MTSLAVPDDITEAVEEMAQRSGQSKDSLLLNALRVYFSPIPAELQKELDVFEQVSDEDYRMVEQLLQGSDNFVMFAVR